MSENITNGTEEKQRRQLVDRKFTVAHPKHCSTKVPGGVTKAALADLAERGIRQGHMSTFHGASNEQYFLHSVFMSPQQTSVLYSYSFGDEPVRYVVIGWGSNAVAEANRAYLATEGSRITERRGAQKCSDPGVRFGRFNLGIMKGIMLFAHTRSGQVEEEGYDEQDEGQKTAEETASARLAKRQKSEAIDPKRYFIPWRGEDTETGENHWDPNGTQTGYIGFKDDKMLSFDGEINAAYFGDYCNISGYQAGKAVFGPAVVPCEDSSGRQYHERRASRWR
ncbi:AT hook motif family protein [Metarhizium anisopliae ARSEF 23] [Zalerion maritima]|uniref:AT hook motif family protein [Metarhizium anisopliae ARSEF 23] n=1 Tax=Zalerion maritima TaxID=339359 RepID=A0AAD5RTP5_9PEZI|nr:AT hook motif family protein [Metarhizium anisopliae ARSEF 23] [Zalerion maritima]